MVKSQAEGAAKRGSDLDWVVSPRRSQRLKTDHSSSQEPPIPGESRKRAAVEALDPSHAPPPKRSRIPGPSAAEALDDAVIDNVDPDNPIDVWRREGRWPRQLFEPEVLTPKRPLSALGGRKRSNPTSSVTPSDQKHREEKSKQYRDPRYETLLATKGSFMISSKLDVTSESKTLCKNLLEREQIYPEDSLFRDDIYDLTCLKIHNTSDARVIQDVARLIVPSAETLATYGDTHLEMLIESVNEGWNNSVPLTGTRPQPDYSVGFQRDSFSEEQLKKLSPFIGNFIAGDRSYFMATYLMYFPFLATEVKCGTGGIDIADRQNAHSTTLAVRGVVELFRLVGREDEVHRKILAFSISQDDNQVCIYGHYPVINKEETKYYRHPIRHFSLTNSDGTEKWTAYRFTRNIYDTWVPDHFRSICSAVDQIPPEIDFDTSALSESTGFSQRPKDHQLTPPDVNSALLVVDEEAGHSKEAGR